MYTSFEVDNCAYLLMEACLGGELWTVMKNRSCFKEFEAHFIIACVAEALHYLHGKGIIHRDLKPENLLLDARGYVKLTDFGFCKYIGTSQRTNSFCGTPTYLAPEMIRRKPYNQAVDYWALGILTYELLTGE